MAIRISAEVWGDGPTLYARGLTHRLFIALLKVADDCRPETRRGRVSHVQLAEALGRVPRSAARALETLEELGVIRKTAPPGRHLPPEYQIACPEDGWRFPDAAAEPAPAAPAASALSAPAESAGAGRPDPTPSVPSSDPTPSVSTCQNAGPTPADPRPDTFSACPDTVGVRYPYYPYYPEGVRAPVRPPAPAPEPDPAPRPPARPLAAGSRCPAHAGLPGEPPPCRGCRDARLGHEACEADRKREATRQASQAARDRAVQRRARIEACGMCDGDGVLPTGALCDHDPGSADRAARGLALCRAALAGKRGGRAAPTPAAPTPAGPVPAAPAPTAAATPAAPLRPGPLFPRFSQGARRGWFDRCDVDKCVADIDGQLPSRRIPATVSAPPARLTR